MEIGGWDPDAASVLLAEFERDLEAITGPGTGTIFKTAILLYRQSVRAYNAKAVDLSAMGCRAVIENGAYALLTHRRKGPTTHERVPYGDPDRPAMFASTEWEPYVSLDALIRALRDRGVIPGPVLSGTFLAKDHGDGVAHFEARRDRENYRELAKRHTQPYVVTAPATDEAGVLVDLRVTREILTLMIKWDIDQGKSTGASVNLGSLAP